MYTMNTINGMQHLDISTSLVLIVPKLNKFNAEETIWCAVLAGLPKQEHNRIVNVRQKRRQTALLIERKRDCGVNRCRVCF